MTMRAMSTLDSVPWRLGLRRLRSGGGLSGRMGLGL